MDYFNKAFLFFLEQRAESYPKTSLDFGVGEHEVRKEGYGEPQIRLKRNLRNSGPDWISKVPKVRL